MASNKETAPVKNLPSHGVYVVEGDARFRDFAEDRDQRRHRKTPIASSPKNPEYKTPSVLNLKCDSPAYIASEELELVAGAPEFIYPAYAVYPENKQGCPDLLDTLQGLKEVIG